MSRPADHDPVRSDEQLLRDHIAGDSEAFGLIFRRHRDHLRAIARRYRFTDHDADDALSDTMIKALTMAGRFRFDARVSSWLYRIMVNSCLDILRRERHRAPIPLASEEWGNLADPLDCMESVILRVSIARALESLTPGQRAAICAVGVEGLSVIEAAARLGIAEGTVKSRCSRARARLSTAALSHNNQLSPNNQPDAA